jgi:hypothetical protein
MYPPISLDIQAFPLFLHKNGIQGKDYNNLPFTSAFVVNSEKTCKNFNQYFMIIFFNNFRAADLHEEKERLARSMGVCRNKEVIEKVLEFAMSDEIRSDP